MSHVRKKEMQRLASVFVICEFSNILHLIDSDQDTLCIESFVLYNKLELLSSFYICHGFVTIANKGSFEMAHAIDTLATTLADNCS